MYSRYMPPHESFHPVEHKDIPPSKVHSAQNPKHNQKPPDSDLLGELTGGIRKFLNGIFDGLSFQNIDSGDILLLLIIIFLYLEGDNLDLVIALGVMILIDFSSQKPSEAIPNEELFRPAE